MLKRLFVVMLALTFSIVLGLPAHAQTLRLQCAYRLDSHVGRTAATFAKELEQITKGGLKVELYGPGPKQLVETGKAFDALGKGEVDLLITSLLYDAAKVPEGNCQWLPFNWQSPDEARDIFFNKGYMKVLAEAVGQHEVVYLTPISAATMGLMTMTPINKLDDLKGKKIRAVGLEAKIVESLGATAVNLPPNGQLEAMKAGTIDGTDYPWYTMTEYKYYEALKSISAPAFHTPGLVDFMASKKVLSSLSAEQQKAVQQAALKAMEFSFEEGKKLDGQAVADAKNKNIEITTLSMDEQALFRKKFKPLWEEAAKASPYSQKLVEILLTEMISKGYTM